MKRILVIFEAGTRWPSAIVRGLAYQELLGNHGFSVTFVTRRPLALEDRLNNLPPLMRRLLGRAGIQRWLVAKSTRASERRIVNLARNADIVYLIKGQSVELVHALKRMTRARIVYDFVDAMWLREMQANEFDAILRNVDAVTTDNELNADYARRINTSCTVIPDVPQVEQFDKRRTELGAKSNQQIILGWLGSPGTAYNLYVVWEALEELFRRHNNLHLRLVGTGNNLERIPEFEMVRFSCRFSYNQSEMIEEVLKMHIGLFPLQNVERCQMRGILKAAIYMSGEAVVVASPVGQTPDLIQHGVNGLLAASTQEWVDQLERLIKDESLRRCLAVKGLETVRSQFRLDQSFVKLKEVFLA